MARNNFLEGIRAGLQSYMQARKAREEEQRSAMEEQYKQMQMNELARKPEQPTLEEKNAAAWDLFQKKSTLTHQQRLEMTDKQNKATTRPLHGDYMLTSHSEHIEIMERT